MKNLVLFLLSISCLLNSCNQESGSITGNWVAEMEDQPQHKYGFTLKDDGNATAINRADLNYTKWEKAGDLLILSAEKGAGQKGNKQNDTLKIIAVTDSTLIVEQARGEKVNFVRISDPRKVISNFETYECFAYNAKNDSAFLHINIADGVVTGDLNYALFEKDKNEGKIEGKMEGDTLLANYTFASEGVESIREVVFLKKGNGWLEGFGEIEENAGSVAFKDRSKLQFKKGLLFKAIKCP